ncbi:DMT family transporter [Fredinandcohnia onubensis]|uniref:DMT family transporter n=1 Tax=Fredinandcohnia onubensis TaxID=1571209 RepID=UPI000C0BC387|nr:DMT family transporter [Fredinandcohnia onubensis]
MGYFLAISAGFCFALNYIFIRKGMANQKDNGTFITMIQNFIFFTIIFGISQIVNPTIEEISLSAFFNFVIGGFLVLFLGRVTLFEGIRKLGSGNAVAIKNSSPLFTFIVAYLFLGEKLNFQDSIAFLMILGGIYYCIFKQIIGVENKKFNSNGKKLGVIFALLSAVFFGIGDIFRKSGMAEFNDPIAGVYLGIIVASICMTIMFFCTKDLKGRVHEVYQSINRNYMLAGVMTAIAMLLFYASLQYIQVIYASILVSLEPVFTVVLMSFMLKNDDKLNKHLLISILLIFIGTIILVIY